MDDLLRQVLSLGRKHALVLLSLPVVVGAGAYAFFLTLGLGAGESAVAALKTLAVHLFIVALGSGVLMALPVVLAIAALWLPWQMLQRLAGVFSHDRPGGGVAPRGRQHSDPQRSWFSTAMCVFPPALAEGFLNDLCHRREQMAREGARQMTIELATAWVYGQAFAGWLFTIVLRVLNVPFPKPKD